jgi:hypothetical protein
LKYYDEVVPSFRKAEPFIHKALDMAKESGTKAMVEAIPFCFMAGYEDYVSELYIPTNVELRDIGRTVSDFGPVKIVTDKKKGPKCRNCKYDLVCEGPWKEYPEKQGFDDFKPVKGVKIKRKEDLLKKC